MYHSIECSSFGAKKILSLDPTGLEIDHDIPSRIEEPESSYDLDLESVIGEERHQWQESK